MGKLFFLFIFFAIFAHVVGQYDDNDDVPQYIKNKYGPVYGSSIQPSRFSQPPYSAGVKSSFTKTKTKTNSGTKNHPRTKYAGGCDSDPPQALNSAQVCSRYSGCKVECKQNYQFPNGDTKLFLTCDAGAWIAKNQGWASIPDCQPVCLPPCQNEGICIAPNQCQCPETFSGPVCQYKKSECQAPPPVNNAARTCYGKAICNITCMNGFQFPNGAKIVTINCNGGYWVPSQPKWTSVPDCEAICSPPCENNGKCIAPNYCSCPQKFRGPQCQYSTENCNPRKIPFMGGYNCTGDEKKMACSLKCPKGTEFDSLPALVYTCQYSEGVYLPTNIPKCVFPGSIFTPFPNNYYHYSTEYRVPVFDNDITNVHGPPPTVNPPHHLVTSQDNGPLYTTSEPYTPPEGLVVVQEKLPEPGICFTWQGTHYKSFDGEVFSFDSKCAHTLIRDAIDNTFSVVVQNDPKCNDAPSDCHKIIKVYLDKEEYILTSSEDGIPVFSTTMKRLPIPGQRPGLRIEMSAHFVILSLDYVGSTIKWDGKQLIQVEVQTSLWNRTEGLCGKLDGDKSNDMLEKNGQQPQTTSNLAISWKVEDLGHECSDLPSEEHTCRENEVIPDLRNQQATVFCRNLLSDKRFAPCHSVVDTSLLFDACKWDYCGCKDADPTKCACETINVYVRACTYRGVKDLAAWRDEKTCPMQCTGGRVYRSCGPPAGQPVCGATTQENEETQEGCVEGCYCPEGTVMHENTCITRDKCPCKLHGKSFPPGAKIPKDCNTCTCNGGKWVCTEAPCGARCAAIGDPHYVTFDGKKYDFMGQCSYYLVKTPTFSIEAENVACAGSISQAMNLPVSVNSGLPSCTKTVTIKISGQTIKLKQNHDVVVNGQDITKIPYQIANITVKSVSSIFLNVDLPNGVQIWWDGVTRVYIDIPAKFQEETKGLCGTLNNNQKDDFVTPEGDVEQAVIPFANKWKTSEKCNDIPDVIKSHPCSANMEKQPTAEKHCRVINSDLFSACHWIVDPNPYYQDCLYDMCSCEHTVSKCLCATVAAYAEECARKGVKIEWRGTVRECGVHCPNGQKYQVCGNSCSRTCFDVAMRPDCQPQCVEGCNCPEGEALNDGGECVPVADCKCLHDGIQFHAGYKEIRSASKGPVLCTCINAQWTCHPATPQEEKDNPKADDLKSLCRASEHMEFTTCEPAEPLTCKNMHSPEYFSASVCHPGCTCKDGYVLDTSTKKCVKPTECPCHHGGRSYKEKEIVQNDCNTCQCQNGKWTCTNRPCAAECTAWGDSHFKTFDGKHFDFQGQCDYVLAKGHLGAITFDISIQNVPCGSLGTSCSKSVTIRVKVGDDQDTFVLTRDRPIPHHETFKHIIVRQVGLLVITEAPDLGLVVQWDKGTRVYIKVDPRWKSRTTGLCGNYNDNDADDFLTPSAGIPEASAKVFGDSWKLQPYCPEALEIIDTCENRPDRKVWAMKQCGILKSSVFSKCHTEVPVDIYLEKCIFDACACDEGGDCECLCTALAAYAQECANRGVPIKWRSQKLCPMQCDERCSNYSPCISTCPVETCDNLLIVDQMSKLCEEENCIEGCAPKPCPPDQIYLNSSSFECVPKNVCKIVCLVVEDHTYYEGDVMEEDACHKCVCSRGEKVCLGQPCSTLTTEIFTAITTTERPTTPSLEQIIQCEPGWSEWINQDKAEPSKSVFRKRESDIEPIPTPLLMNNIAGGKCNRENIAQIECRTVKTHLSPKETGLDVECSLENGLICKSSEKGKLCPDFEIRVLCVCEEATTTISPECNLLTPYQEHPDNCSLYYFCENTGAGPRPVLRSCSPSKYYNPVTTKCAWPYEVEEIKPECKETITIGPPVTVPPESEGCPPGTEQNDCAIQCDRLCQFYSHVVGEKGICRNQEKCQPDCVTVGKNVTCPEGKWYNDKDTCVDKSDCLCRSTDGKLVKPGDKYRESDCKVCQCVDNHYSCNDEACFTTTRAPATTTKSPFWIPEPPPYGRSTSTPPEECTEDRFIDIIQGDEDLPDNAFNATSELNSDYKPQNARFNSSASWSPKYSNNQQYLQIDLGRQEPLYGIKIKGSPLYDEYVTSYKVTYSPDGRESFRVVVNNNRLPQTFRGSVDPKTPILQTFDIPIEAQIIRIHPETWHNAISLKVELIGCGEPRTTPTLPYEIITTVKPPPMCDDPMGLDAGTMPHQQIRVSSELNDVHSQNHLKLSSENAWQPSTDSPTEFVTLDFSGPRNITGIETKGGPDGWVKTFTVQYSQDNTEWNQILDKTKAKEVTFLGNFDEDTSQYNSFDIPINARYLKIIPTTWEKHIQMRVEVHGCYEPYPTFPPEIPSVCNVCKGVQTEPMEMQACHCKSELWWDGKNCVKKRDCPCIIKNVRYEVGKPFKDGCSRCLCKMGGVMYCSPKPCPPCENGLRKTVTPTCHCTCQPCPEGTTLCPSSNICINTTSWCNGVKDCPDDETNCPTEAPPSTKKNRTKPCPDIECPEGFTKLLGNETKGQKYQSSKFLKHGTKSSYTGHYSGVKTVKKPSLPKPPADTIVQTEEIICPRYFCKSEKPPPPLVPGEECSSYCPEKFIPVMEESSENVKTNQCPSYVCKPPPPPDATCDVSSTIFRTFDSAEYNYDKLCNHVLARELQEDKWSIVLKKNCDLKLCQRTLGIYHGHDYLVLHSNLTLEYNGFKYTQEQIKKILQRSHALFSISRVGNTLRFKSDEYGFWITLDDEGNVKVGVSTELAGQVDGLCGFFNEKLKDDKRKPDGTPARTTVGFGDSWKVNAAEKCEPETCPVEIQKKAWELCQVRAQILEPCTKVVPLDNFVSRCTESTCRCLQNAANNQTALQECRCKVLTDYVVNCLTNQSTIDLPDWRTALDCPVTCEAPLIYHDCYRRECEPTCDSIRDPKMCPKLPQMCFPGCYCPPGFVKMRDTCIKPSNCKNCECNVLPHLKYVTYDERNFTVNANCVYVMSRDILPQGETKHKFQVLITNAPCKNNQEKTCVGKVTILYQGRKIHVINDLLRDRLKLIVDGERIDDVAEISSWSQVKETATKHYKILLTDIQVEVSVYFPSLGVSVKAPSLIYEGKLEGLCGDCNNQPENDFRTPSGNLTKDPDEFAVSWLYEHIPGGQSKEECRNTHEPCESLPKETDPCNLLLDYETFGQCIRVLDPSLFIEWCRNDTCNNHPEFACASIEAYARDCANAGFCIDWRTNLCPKTCPADKIYKPCGTGCPETCESIKDKIGKEKSCSKNPVEGCFCPEGKVLLNETCVIPKDCEVCDEEGHHPGDKWKKDKCTNCTCEGTSLKCEKERCGESERICEVGYQPMTIPAGENECCDKYTCSPEQPSETTCEPPKLINCGHGQTMKTFQKPNGCDDLVCECIPRDECEPVDESQTALEPGYVKEFIDDGCCPQLKITCKPETCPEPQTCPPHHVLKNETGKCCPIYTCEPPKDKCIYDNEYTSAETGGERPRTEMEKQTVLKNANETWNDGPCRHCKCSRVSGGNYVATCTKTDCPPLSTSDKADYQTEEVFTPGGCCPELKRVACIYGDTVYKVGQSWTKEGDPCTIYRCVDNAGKIEKERNIENCNTKCDDGFKYVPATNESEQCCGSCKPYACVVGGKIYKEHENWQSDDNCINYFCLSIQGTFQVQSQKTPCPEPPEDFENNFVYENITFPGECCEEYKPVACKVDGKVYKVGETWPSPDGDKCKNITCIKNDKGEIIKQEMVKTCKTECSTGSKYVESNNTCCGDCVPFACVVNGETKVPGKQWTSADKCTTFTCEQFGDQFMVASSQESCPSLEDCPEENIYAKGCCKHCNLTTAAQKLCTVGEVPLNKTVGIIRKHLPGHGECVNAEPISTFTECSGTCTSSTFFNQKKLKFESNCSCCQGSKSVPVDVELDCEDGYRQTIKVSVPSECACVEACSHLKNTKTKPLTFVKS